MSKTVAQRLLAGEHYGCREWREVAAKFGVNERSLRGVRSLLRAQGFDVELGLAGTTADLAPCDRCGRRPSKSMGCPDRCRAHRDTDREETVSAGVDLPVRERWPNVAAFDKQPEPRIEVVPETITRIEEHRLKRRVKDLESELKQLTAQMSEGGEYHEVIAEVLAHQHEAPPPRIAPRERTSGLREGTPLVLASDWHIEEEVRPEQVAGRNRYNLEIATKRMERFFEATRWSISHQREVYKIRDMIGWWGGDLITNFLHDDNIESNLLHPTEAILMAQTEIAKGIEYWLEDPEIEQFTFICNDGNHGRLTDKMHSATRIQNSLEVFLYAQLAMRFRNEPRVRFILPTSQFTFLDDVYGRTIRALHGDVFKYGGGVGGITVPMYKALARWETVKRADLTIMGHWHQRICLPNVMVNGSLIGYNAYAMGGGFPFEAPSQSMRMLDAHRWCGPDIPLFVSDRADDVMSEAA